MQEFFNLLREEKKKLWQLPGNIEGFGQIFVVSEEQKLDWGDIFYINTLPIHLRNLFLKIPLPFSALSLSLSLSLNYQYFFYFFSNIFSAKEDTQYNEMKRSQPKHRTMIIIKNQEMYGEFFFFLGNTNSFSRFAYSKLIPVLMIKPSSITYMQG